MRSGIVDYRERFKIEKGKSKENNKKFDKQNLTFFYEYSIVAIEEVREMENFRDYISVDPKICHGQPCFKVSGRPTRIMIYLVLELLEAGVSVEEILSSYYPKLTKNHIQAALHYATELMKTGESVPFAEVI